MAPTSLEDHIKFLVSCVKHSNLGRVKVDFGQVALESNVVSKGAAAKRYERLVRQFGSTSVAATSTQRSNATASSSSVRAPKNLSRSGNSYNASAPASTSYGSTSKSQKRKQDAYADEIDAAADDDEEYTTQSSRAMPSTSMSQHHIGNDSPHNHESGDSSTGTSALSYDMTSSGSLMEKNKSMARYLNDRKAVSSDYLAAEKNGGYGGSAGRSGTPDTYSGGILGPRFPDSDGLERDGHHSMGYRGASMPYGSYGSPGGMQQYYRAQASMMGSPTPPPSRFYGGAFGSGQHQQQQLTHGVPKRQKTAHGASTNST